MSKIKLLLLVIDLILIHTVDSSNVRYVTPSPTTQCPGEFCLTLSTLAANSSDYFDSNTTLVFLEGSHTLDSVLVMSNIDDSQMLSTNDSGTAAIIQCSSHNAGLEFSDIKQLQISGLEFIGCSIKVEFVDQFTLEDSRFHGGNHGSALYLNYADASIVRSSFVFNIAGTYQSHVAVLRDNGYFEFTSTRAGGALLVTSSTVDISSSHFKSNAATVGGAIFSQTGSNITISNCTFINNSAAGCNRRADGSCHGGALFMDSGSTVTAHNSTFVNNTSGYGGAIALFQGTSLESTHNVFSGNRADELGGAICAYSRSRIIIGNSCYSNNIGRYGGAIFTLRYGNITVGNSSFDNNEAGSRGGVMYAWHRSSITVGNSSFGNNEAGSDGGVMSAYDGSRIIVGNSSFDNSEAGNDGGVMSAWYSSSITVDSSSFDNNEAGSRGGVMYARDISSITVDNSSFGNNKAGRDGGVMFAYYGCSITVSSSSFGNNVAHSVGGVMYAHSRCSITVGNSSFDNNVAGNIGGVMHAHSYSIINVGNSSFDNNEAGNDGGVMYAYSSSCITVGSSFDNNIAGRHGGVIHAYDSNSITVRRFFDSSAAGNGEGISYVYSSTISNSNCTFFNNSAPEGGVVYIRIGSFVDFGNMYIGNTASNGGVIVLVAGDVNITASSFDDNTAANVGGVLYVHNFATITLTENIFHNNQATRGGVIALLANNDITAIESTFSHNRAARGGTIYLLIQNKLTVKYSNFSHNSAESDGGVIYSADQNRLVVGNSLLTFNRADNNGGVVCSLFRTELTIVGDNCTFIGNQGHRGGVAYVSESNINVYSQSLLLANNTATNEGGAGHLSSAMSEHNTVIEIAASFGGALCVVESQLTFSNGSCQLLGNLADYGGAIYASESKVVVEENSYTNLSSNLAIHQGGGIHVANSSIIIEGTFHLINNTAENGGAISLERNAELQGIINLVSNRASLHGGALYINDKTNPEMCAANNEAVSSKTDCFSKSVFINFSNNSAGISGMNLFGGLLDRCTVHTESYQKSITTEHPAGLVSFQNSSSINKSQLDTISSYPVQICFCRDGQPDCNHQPEPIQVNRGKSFSIEVIAYDQVHHPVNASVQCILNSSAGGLGVGQQIQNISRACTDLKYDLFTPNNYEELTFSAVRGPCNNIEGISERSVMIEIICLCPLGFQKVSNTSCVCTCDQVLQSYEKTECNPTTESIIRRENFWISYINHTRPNSSGYVIYPHCPFDYCYTADKSVSINLNLPNGADTQCASNRTGVLCGTCKSGLSVSLGSSKCVRCPTYWPGLLVTITIVFIISGIGLVAFLLALNLTVAVGTLNAIIFYANIVAANKSVLFPSGVSPASVFISWLNFDLGFDLCFFDDMDTYVKTWLQLAFPAYIIILVVVIIQVSYYFNAFGHLVGKKDPVATLATLILLSYAKLLQTIITAFFSATLEYPDGSKKTLWLPDATIEYFTSKHAVLFFVAVLILLAGLIYTFLLFSWQWFLWCPRKQVKWIRNQKFSSFMEMYLVPYAPKHRYWTGLLLLVRVSIYLVSAFNPSDDPRLTLSATNFILTSLVIYIATFGVRLYENRFINTMETLTYFNIMALTIFTWYTIDADTNQTIITNISIGITFFQLTAIVVFHAYKYLNQKFYVIIKGSTIYDKIMAKKEVNNYNIPQIQPKPVEPTQSVVEISVKRIPSPRALLEAIKEKTELESEQQQELREQDEIDMIPVTKENLAKKIDKNKQCSCPGIEILERDDSIVITKPRNDIEHSCTIFAENSIPKLYSNPQINSYSDIKQAKKEAMEMTQSDNKGQRSQKVPPFPAGSGQQEKWCGSQCTTVEAEIHDY